MAHAQVDEEQSGRATIRDVAAHAGVSIATVSRVLNGRPDVSEKTREHVMRHIREQGFSVDRAPRATSIRRTNLIGLTVPSMHAGYFAEIIAGAAEALYERDARFVLCPTQHEHDREVSLMQRIMHGTTDGALLILPSESNEELLALRDQGFPYVVIDAAETLHVDIPIVGAANFSGARSAVEHLISLGHRRIAAIAGLMEWTSSVDRLAGYRYALHSHGIPVGEELIREANYLIDGGYRAAGELLSLPTPPTAIFAFNDNMAVGALRAAISRGMRVPHDLSIVGFDDVEIASLVTPALTTIRQPLQEMGRVGAVMLMRLLDGRSVEATRLELSTTLVVRESTGRPRQA